MKEKEDIKKWMFLILFGVLSYFLINNLHLIWNIIITIYNVFLPFILGGVVAFILNIPMTKIETLLNKKLKNDKLKPLIRILSIILSLIIFILIFGLVLFLLIPELIENIETLITNIPGIVNEIESFVLNLLKEHPEIQIEIKEMFKNVNTSTIFSNLLEIIVNSSISFIGSLVSSLVTIFMSIVFSVYMLSQKEYLINGFKKVINAFVNKKKSIKIFEICTLANKTFSKFISGQCVDAAILGLMMFIVLSIFKFPYSLLISVLTAVTALIPVFGALIAMLVGALLIGITSPIDALIFIVIFQIVQQIEGNFIYPRVVGRGVGLSPLWTLLAITVGGNLCGVVGMLIGLPLASIAYAIFRSYVNDRIKLKEKKRAN